MVLMNISTPRVLVGGGAQYFDKITIDDHKIILSGLKRLPSDAMCCPSGAASIRYLVAERQLMAIGTGP